MIEKLVLQDDQLRWSPEVEAEVETGVMTPLEADEQEGLVEPVTAPSPDSSLSREIDRLVDHGFSRGVAEKMVGVSPEDSAADAIEGSGRTHQEPRPRPGYVKDGSRRIIKTSADARAADRLPDEDWRYR